MHQDQTEIESESDSVYSENNRKDNSKNSDYSNGEDENDSENGDSSSNEDKNSSTNSDCFNNKSEEEYYDDDEQEIRRLKIKSIMKILHTIKDMSLSENKGWPCSYCQVLFYLDVILSLKMFLVYFLK